MKVIKITKKYRNGIIEHFLIVDESYTTEDIDEEVQEWCENDLHGINSGWSADWVVIDDEETIKKIIKKTIFDMKSSIDVLESRKNKLIKYLNTLQNEN